MANMDIPSTYSVQDLDFERRRKLADLLQQQSQQPLSGGMAGNVFVAPSWTQALAKVLQGVVANKQQDQILSDQKDATLARQNALSGTMDRFNTALNGKSALTTSPDDFDESGAAIPQRTVPAVAGDRNSAVAELLRNPDTSSTGMQLALQGMAPSKFGDTPHYDQAGRAFVLDQNGNTKYLGGIQARDKSELSPSGVAYNPYALAAGTVLPDPNKPFNVGPNGQAVPNTPYQNYEMGKAHAGASNVNVRTDVKTGESLAAQVGPMMASSRSAAEGATQQMDIANRLDNAISAGKVYAGPGAKVRLGIAQIGQVLGVAGKDTIEKIQNTRATIQNLAQFSLAGRSLLKGQGSVSDNEGKLLQQAVSGNIEDMTIPELKVITGVAKRVSAAQYSEHQRNMQVMRSKPGLSDIADFYDVPQMPGGPHPAGGQVPNIPQGGMDLHYDSTGRRL